MKKITMLFVVLSLFMVRLACAASIDQIVTFGDSLSDNGNLYKIKTIAHKANPSVVVIPASPPYYKGRFTNDLVWVEYLAKMLGLDSDNKAQLADFAVGGAWVEGPVASKQPLMVDLNDEVSLYLYLARKDKNKGQHLYTMWMGANDYLSNRLGVNLATTEVVKGIRTQIERLISHGARRFMILNVPDFAVTPYGRSVSIVKQINLTALADANNKKLAAMVADLRLKYSNVLFMTINIHKQFAAAEADPASLGLTNVTQACNNGGYADATTSASTDSVASSIKSPILRMAYAAGKLGDSQVCSDPQDYMFWDQVHPTSGGQQYTALQAYQILEKNKLA